MTGERIVPGALGLKTFHTLGSSGYKPDVDNNFLILSALAQFTALSYTTFLPGAPTQGMIYIVPGNAGANPNQIALYDNAAWSYILPQDGMFGYLSDERKFVAYNSTLATWEYLDLYSETSGPTSSRNLLANSSFDNFNEGTTFSTTGSQVSDMWYLDVTSGSFSSNVFTYAGGTDLPEGTRQYLSLATTGNSTLVLRQRVKNVRRLNGRKITVSAYTRVGSGAATVNARVKQVFGTGGSTTATLTGTAVAQTGSFVRSSWTFSLASTAASTVATDGTDYLEIALIITITGATNAHIACIAAEPGSWARVYERRPREIDAFLAGRLQLNLDRDTDLILFPSANVFAQYGGAPNSDAFSLYQAYGLTPGGHNATPHHIFQVSRGSRLSPTAIGAVVDPDPTYFSLGDFFGAILGTGHDGTAMDTIGRSGFGLRPSEVWTSTAHGAEVVVAVTPNGTKNTRWGFKFANDGRYVVNLNSTAPEPPLIPGATALHTVGPDGMASVLNMDGYGGLGILVGRLAGGTRNAKTPTPAATPGFLFGAQGWDGSAYNTFSNIAFNTVSAQSSTDHSGNATISTCAVGSTAFTEKFRFADDGRMLIGNSSGAEKLTVTGNAAPSADNVYTCGTSATKWSAIWSANGTIQTSDAREKDIIERISAAEATAFVDGVAPVKFRWRVGGHDEHREIFPIPEEDRVPGNATHIENVTYTPKPGARIHAGFIAQEIKAAMDANGDTFGAWGLEDASDPDSMQFLRPDQLVPVLWQALRETRRELAELKAKVG